MYINTEIESSYLLGGYKQVIRTTVFYSFNIDFVLLSMLYHVDTIKTKLNLSLPYRIIVTL